MLLQIVPAGMDDALDLAPVYGFYGIHVIVAGTRADLDENDSLAVLENQIHLAAAGTKVFSQKLQAVAGQKPQGTLFRLFSHAVGKQSFLQLSAPTFNGTGLPSTKRAQLNCLRMRPERIIVGEVRSGETLDIIQAMNTGHTTFLG